MSQLTHIDANGNARMVEVSDKPVSHREATADGFIAIGPEALARIVERTAKKGDVLAVAQLAGIGGAKQAGTLIPLCHPIPLSGVSVELAVRKGGVYCTATAKADWRTGVEMEALTAVSTALLTVYDMLKAVDRSMTIGPISLVDKRGGRSGHWKRD